MDSTLAKAARGTPEDAGSIPASSTDCLDCGHPIGWHGDRAVCPCDADWTAGANPFARNGTRLSMCPCLGYRNPVRRFTTPGE